VTPLTVVLSLAGTLGCGLVAGVFFAFSTFVMRALERRPAPEAIAVMQSINVAVLNPWFLVVFVGTALVCAGASAAAIARWQSGSGWILAGGALYLLGCFLVTMRCNVPRNEALAALDATAPSAATAWSTYVRDWTFWNHVRTVCSLAASGAFAGALAA
jgi:uncharacterized membrane protein